MKKYFIRVAKYIVLFYVIAALILGLMWYLGTGLPSPSHLLNQRLLVGVLILGFVWPFVGFKRLVIDLPVGGREAHEQKVCEVIELAGFRRETKQSDDADNDGDKITFIAISPVRRLAAMYEERITLHFRNSASIAVSGLRKDVARIGLRIGDYVRYAKQENK
jgi:hypothetical protein